MATTMAKPSTWSSAGQVVEFPELCDDKLHRYSTVQSVREISYQFDLKSPQSLPASSIPGPSIMHGTATAMFFD